MTRAPTTPAGSSHRTPEVSGVAQRHAEPWHTDTVVHQPVELPARGHQRVHLPRGTEDPRHHAARRRAAGRGGTHRRREGAHRRGAGRGRSAPDRGRACPRYPPPTRKPCAASPRLGLPSEIYAFCRCVTTSDVRLAADCGVKSVVMEVPASRPPHREGLRLDQGEGARPLHRGHGLRPRARPQGGLLPHRRHAFRRWWSSWTTWAGWRARGMPTPSSWSTPWAFSRRTPWASSCGAPASGWASLWRPTSTRTSAWAWPTR